MERVTYEELCSVKVSDTRYVVISRCSKGGFTIGQKIIIDDGDKQIEMFLKGAIHINNEESLKNIMDCIQEILKS